MLVSFPLVEVVLQSVCWVAIFCCNYSLSVRRKIEEGLLLFSVPFRTPYLPFPRTALSKEINTCCYCNVPLEFRRVKGSELGELHSVRRGSADGRTRETNSSVVVQPWSLHLPSPPWWIPSTRPGTERWELGCPLNSSAVQVRTHCFHYMLVVWLKSSGVFLASLAVLFFPSHLQYAPSLSCSLLVVTQIGSHMVSSALPSPLRYVPCVIIAKNIQNFLPPSARGELCLPTL